VGRNRRSEWRVQIHAGMEKAGRDELLLLVERGENQTPFGGGRYARFTVVDGLSVYADFRGSLDSANQPNGPFS
jgi:hypothetical protein